MSLLLYCKHCHRIEFHYDPLVKKCEQHGVGTACITLLKGMGVV